jgi:hypothetical protein
MADQHKGTSGGAAPVVLQALGFGLFAFLLYLDAFGPDTFAAPVWMYFLIFGLAIGVRPESLGGFMGFFGRGGGNNSGDNKKD